MLEWSRHILDDRITFDEAWTKMGLHHERAAHAADR